MTSVRELRRQARTRLAEADVPSPQVDADLLLAHVLDVTPTRLALVPELSVPEAEAFEDLLGRRAAREPLQHLTGTAPFRTLLLAVGPGVFVPRPETELLAGWVVERLRTWRPRGDGSNGSGPNGSESNVSGPPTVVDVGTGSGAVALSVAVEAPGARVVACEPDPRAREWARRNIAQVRAEHRIDVRLSEATAAQLAEGAEDSALPPASVDVVVSNPPYVPLDAPVAPEVQWDPHRAVFAAEDGCEVIADVVAVGGRLLRTGGHLAVEHDEGAGAQVRALLATTLWTGVTTHPDLARRPRFTVAQRSSAPYTAVGRS